MHINELDVVRILRPLSGDDPYAGRPVSVPAGELGTVILGAPGRSAYDVEFFLYNARGNPYNAILTVEAEDLELVPPSEWDKN